MSLRVEALVNVFGDLKGEQATTDHITNLLKHLDISDEESEELEDDYPDKIQTVYNNIATYQTDPEEYCKKVSEKLALLLRQFSSKTSKDDTSVKADDQDEDQDDSVVPENSDTKPVFSGLKITFPDSTSRTPVLPSGSVVNITTDDLKKRKESEEKQKTVPQAKIPDQPIAKSVKAKSRSTAETRRIMSTQLWVKYRDALEQAAVESRNSDPNKKTHGEDLLVKWRTFANRLVKGDGGHEQQIVGRLMRLCLDDLEKQIDVLYPDTYKEKFVG